MFLYTVSKWFKGLLLSGLALSSVTVFQAGSCGMNFDDLNSLVSDVISELEGSDFGSGSGGWDEPYSDFEEPGWDECNCGSW